LRNCLRPLTDDLESTAELIDLSRRAEQLSVAEFVELTNFINKSRQHL